LFTLCCDICNTNIGVRKEQIGEEIVCPECGTKIIVPESIIPKAAIAKKAISRTETYSLRGEPPVPTDTVLPDDWSKKFRLPCRLCGTVLFVTEAQVGTFVTCPDCETKTEVLPPPKTSPKKSDTVPLPSSTFEGDSVFDTATPSTKGTEEPSSVLPKENLVPVICRLCGTRMYAKESQIGQFKTCPDCGLQTEIKAVPKHLMVTPTETTSADAYGLSNADTQAPRRTLRTLTDYRHVEGSLDKDIHVERYGERGSHRSVNRPQLPKRPLTERFFVPFGYSETWLRLILFVATAPLSILIIFLYTYLMEGFAGVGMLILSPLIFIMYVTAFGFFATFLIHLYDITSGGTDKGEFKGEIAPFDYVINGLWLFAFSFVATLPGLFFASFLCRSLGLTTDSPVTASLVLYVLMRISHGFFFPIFFLSSIEAGSMFAVFAKNTLFSLYRQPFAWFRFYLLTGVLFVLSDLCSVFTVWLDPTGSMFVVSLTVFCFLFAMQSLFFFRLLGRLAWLLEETDRQKRESEEEKGEK
jgi:DNA-directed RNA polymerase subunit M/transcription elongation factor TFIIS